MKGGGLRGVPPATGTPRQIELLAAYIEARGSVRDAATSLGISFCC